MEMAESKGAPYIISNNVASNMGEYSVLNTNIFNTAL